MKTKIFNSKQIKQAADLIKKGELVAFPTETVYGLGANALDSNAVKKIFIAKGRPSDNPLIVHISKKEQINEIAYIPISKKRLVNKLIKKFWPGPLTIILRKKKIIPDEVTCGLKTVAIRMPKNKIALSLIENSKVPIAAPSANLSGKPSGTSFRHVLKDFNGKIAGIIKSKDCEIGLESTVIDMTADKPMLLRPGLISFEKLKKIIPKLSLFSCNNLCNNINKVKSPGIKYKHYSPNAKIILFNTKDFNKIKIYENKLKKQNKKVKIIKTSKKISFAKKLFKIFRDADEKKIDFLLIQSVEESGIGRAIMNRLKKASYKIIN
ncbi:MAG: L-threonylcarbamoyladenylate synthase [Candidatus Pacearchaeota archaeon]